MNKMEICEIHEAIISKTSTPIFSKRKCREIESIHAKYAFRDWVRPLSR